MADLIKAANLKRVNIYFSKSKVTVTKIVDTRRSTVLSLPLQ
jgi:hypothetical protein